MVEQDAVSLAMAEDRGRGATRAAAIAQFVERRSKQSIYDQMQGKVRADAAATATAVEGNHQYQGDAVLRCSLAMRNHRLERKRIGKAPVGVDMGDAVAREELHLQRGHTEVLIADVHPCPCQPLRFSTATAPVAVPVPAVTFFDCSSAWIVFFAAPRASRDRVVPWKF